MKHTIHIVVCWRDKDTKSQDEQQPYNRLSAWARDEESVQDVFA